MEGDALWYEAAFVVGITNALNVVADALTDARALGAAIPDPDESKAPPEAAAIFGEIRTFYARVDVPVAFRLLATDPGYLTDVFGATRRAFSDQTLTRRVKEALAFAVSVTTRSAFGTAFHLGEMRRLGVGDRGVMEILGVTQMFSSYTKIADTLQLEPDMGDIAPSDPTPAPGA
jgi:alkylhydroperoxidase/carboxymuconolactone decarboxylase family protein YurZ